MKRLAAAAALAVSAALTVSACGDDDSRPAARDDASAEGVNDADVAFATEMIQHHAGALAMVDMTVGRDLDPKVAALADDIRAAQAPEIETMSDWLEEWGEPVPATMRDHANAHGGHSEDDTGSDMPGMMSAEETDQLEAMPAADFEDAWLRAMIEHHQGAIEMAETEQSDGESPEAVALAEEIAADQEVEITEMEAMLGS